MDEVIFSLSTRKACFSKRSASARQALDGWFALTCPLHDLWRKNIHARSCCWCEIGRAHLFWPLRVSPLFPFRANQEQPEGNLPRGLRAHKPKTGLPKWDAPFERGRQRQPHCPPKAHVRGSPGLPRDPGDAAVRYGQEEGGLPGASEAEIPSSCLGHHGSPGTAAGAGQWADAGQGGSVLEYYSELNVNLQLSVFWFFLYIDWQRIKTEKRGFDNRAENFLLALTCLLTCFFLKNARQEFWWWTKLSQRKNKY